MQSCIPSLESVTEYWARHLWDSQFELLHCFSGSSEPILLLGIYNLLVLSELPKAPEWGPAKHTGKA